ncbi:discoidin domain-containing protein, partial [Actinospica sp. MGRD01-02]
QGQGRGSKVPEAAAVAPRFTLPSRRTVYAGVGVVVLLSAAFGIAEYAGHGAKTTGGAVAQNIVPSMGVASARSGMTSGVSASASASTLASGSAPGSASASGSASSSAPATSTAVSETSAAGTSQLPATSADTTAASPAHAGSAATTAPAATDLALGKAESSSSHTGSHVAANVIDGDAGTYWESQVGSGSFTEWVQVDLEKAMTVSKIVMRLPADWSSRTESIEIYGLATGYDGFVIEPTTTYSFNEASGNAVTVKFAALSTRYIQLIVTANSAVDAGEMGEIEVYG